MPRGIGWLKEPSFHVVFVAAVLAAVLAPAGHERRPDTTRGAGHHGGRCHACSFALPAELARERDAALVRAGCIEAPGDGE